MTLVADGPVLAQACRMAQLPRMTRPNKVTARPARTVHRPSTHRATALTDAPASWYASLREAARSVHDITYGGGDVVVTISTVIWKFPNVGSVELRFRSVDSVLAAARDRRVLLGSRVPVGSSHPKGQHCNSDTWYLAFASISLGIIKIRQ